MVLFSVLFYLRFVNVLVRLKNLAQHLHNTKGQTMVFEQFLMINKRVNEFPSEMEIFSLITGRARHEKGKSCRKYENSYLLGSH